MKKLALALVCFVSVAFFASCSQEVTNPEPSIAVMTGEDFMYDGQTINLFQDYSLGFRAAANSQTKKELATFTLVGKVYDMEDNEIFVADTALAISGTEYVYQETWSFGSRELIAKVAFIATVTDVDGKSNSTTINVTIDKPAIDLVEEDFTWFRHGGNDATGLEEYGLEWTGNGKEVFAIIKPVEGATLYSFPAETWNEVTTDVENAAIFSEALSVLDFRGVSAWYTKTYDYVIGTLYNDEYHLIHITKGVVDSSTAGTDITITGQSK